MNCCLYQPVVRSIREVNGFTSRPWLSRLFALFLRACLTASVWLLFLVTPPALKAGNDLVTNTLAGQPVDHPSGQASASGATNQANVLDDKYKLAIGDQLSFRIVEDEDDPKLLAIKDSGDLEVPYIGRYPAVGKTCKELAQDLKREFEKTYYWHATVIMAVDSKPRSRGKIYISGAIGTAGPQDISGDETLTVSKAILRAGGLTSFANGTEVKVWRSAEDQPGGEKTFIINVSKILEKGETGQDMPLQPGDLIYVPERMIRF
jgi:polysaccharide export outer membrane protein